MPSNTKLSREQKDNLEAFKAGMNPKTEAFGQSGDTTVFVRRVSSSFAYVSASYASPEETKFRPKVGQYNAAERFDSGEFMLMKVDIFDHDVQSVANSLAYLLS